MRSFALRLAGSCLACVSGVAFFHLINPMLSDREFVMKLYSAPSHDRKTTVTTVLGLISLLLLLPSLANGVTLIDQSPRVPRGKKLTVHHGKPQKFRIEVKGENWRENIQSITFTTEFSLGPDGDNRYTKIKCTRNPFRTKETCVGEVEYTWDEHDASVDRVSVTVETSQETKTWEWDIQIKEPPPNNNRDDRREPIPQSTSLIIDKIPMERDVYVPLKTPQKFWIQARAEKGDQIKSISFFTYYTNTNTLTEQGLQDKKEKIFDWPRRTKDYEEDFAWVESEGRSSYSETVIATVRTTHDEWQQHIWTIHVGAQPQVPSSTLIIDKSPKEEDVYVPLRTRQRFWIRARAEQGDTIESISFFTYDSQGTTDELDYAVDKIQGSELLIHAGLGRTTLEKECDWWTKRRERECEVYIGGDSHKPYTDLVVAIVRTQKGKLQQHVWTRYTGTQPDKGPQKRPGPYRPEVLSPNIYVNASKSLNLENFFYHPDGSPLDYSKRLSEKGIVAVKWNKAKTQMTLEGVEPGTVEVTAIAETKGSNLTAKQIFEVTVINRAPKLKSPISDIRKNEGLVPGGTAKRLYLSYYFMDPDGDTLKYHKPISNKTDVVSVEIKRDTLWITPVGGGTAEVTVTATDGHTDKRTVTDSFDVTVNAPPTNLSYEIISPLKADLQNLVIDEYVWVRVNATDPDDKKRQLTYKVDPTKGGVVEAEFRTNSGPSKHSSGMRIKALNVGTDTLRVTVSDGTSDAILDIPVRVPESDANLAKAKPDLAILELTAGKDTLDPDEIFNLDVTMQNKGSVATSGSGKLLYYLWSHPPTDDDWKDQPHEMSSIKKLKPGVVYDKSIYVRAPTTPGTYYYGAFVFPDKKESNENNNRSNVIQITVTGQNAQNSRPDVIVDNPLSLTLEADGYSYAIYVSRLFRDSDGDPLKYKARSSDPGVATVSISPHGDDLVITPLSAGTTTITVTAADPYQTVTLTIILTVTGYGIAGDFPVHGPIASFQGFHVVIHNLSEKHDLSAACKAELGVRLADWNDIVAYYNRVGSMADFLRNLDIRVGSGYRVTWNGQAIWGGGLADGRKRHFFFARHDYNKPENFLDHDNIHNHLLTLGSWYGSGGYALCYGTLDAAAPLLRLHVPVTPTSTTVLPNYPNPFNPETWIPYQLATPAEVTLAIYNVQGTLVRQLALGHQSAGFYHSRSRAAYWDGKNAFGERVASGLYFYTFTAGNFTTTRKMLIMK